MNFISLDLELNNTESNLENPKIIQVGISIGNPSEIILTKSWYIDPNEPIYDFIINLTGITDETIKTQSVSLGVVAKELSDLIVSYNCFVNPVVWGAGDVPKLISEFKDNNIEFKHFGRREMDVKQIYTFLMFSQNRNLKGGLSSAMGRFNLPFKGKAHRADVDAENTLRFYFKLLERQNKLENLLGALKDIK